LLIVLPGRDLLRVNHVDGPAWGDCVADDLVQHIDGATAPGRRPLAGHRRPVDGRPRRADAGHHPDRFRVVGLQSSLRPADRRPFFGTDDEFRQRDAVELVKVGRVPAGINLWLDVGDEDWWLEGTLALHATLQEQGVAHAWHLFPGVHDGPYWADHLVDYLHYYGAALASSSASGATLTPPRPLNLGQGGAP
jgi:hypothetical protein